MWRVITFIVWVSPGLAFGQDALFDLAGVWGGAGTYLDRNISEEIRCRMNISSDLEMTEIEGVCASARRKENLNLRISRGVNNELSIEDLTSNTRNQGQMHGVLYDDGVRFSLNSNNQVTSLTILLTSHESMEWKIVISTQSRTQSTAVEFVRQ